MSAVKDGGTLFPFVFYDVDSTGEYKPRSQEFGISVKDYYRGLSFQTILEGLMCRYKDGGYTDEAAIFEAIRLSEYAVGGLIERMEK